MFPLLSILIALMLGLSYTQFYGPGETAPDLTGASLIILFTAVFGRIVSYRAVRLTLREDSESPGRLLQASSTQRLLVVVAYGFVVHVCDWPAVVDRIGIRGWILLDELVILLPFVVLLYDSFLTAWSGEHALDLHEFSRKDYLLFQTRQFLLPVTPILIFLVFADLIDTGSAVGVEWVAMLKITTESYPFASWVFFGLLLFTLYCLMPFVMRWMWRLESMPAGPLRERLEEFSRQEGFRARDLLVWPTGGNILNAAVIGIAAPFRYVLMTDALVAELAPDEVEAVFAHEVGHAKHNHLLKFFFFILGYTLFFFLVLEAFGPVLAPILAGSVLSTLAFFIGGILLWFGLLMGFVSRRFEQQADVYGALSMGRVRGAEGIDGEEHPFVRALTRIGMQMGDIRENKGWRHFSLGSRIEFIRRFLVDEGEQRRYRRRIGGLLLFFFGLLGAIGIAAAATIPSQITEGRIRAAKARAAWLETQDRPEEAKAEADRARQLEIDAGHLVLLPPLDATARRPGLWKDMNRRYDAATNERLGFGARLVALRDLAVGYLLLEMPIPARQTVDEVFVLTAGFSLPPLYKAQLLELMGLALKAEGRPKGARLALEDALALIPPAAPGAQEFAARIRVSLVDLDPVRNR